MMVPGQRVLLCLGVPRASRGSSALCFSLPALPLFRPAHPYLLAVTSASVLVTPVGAGRDSDVPSLAAKALGNECGDRAASQVTGPTQVPAEEMAFAQ